VKTVLLQSYIDEFNLGKECFNMPAIPGTVLKKPAEDGRVFDGKDNEILRSGIGITCNICILILLKLSEIWQDT
jgi:hypothetical protein